MPSSAGKGWGRHWGAFKLLYYHCNTTKIDRVEQSRTVCGAEECRGVPSSAGKGWGRHWGAFKLLYYHCNTTKIDRVEQPRTVCGAEECRRVPSSAGKGWGRHWGAFKLLYYHCMEQPRTVCGAEEWRGVPKSSSAARPFPFEWYFNGSRATRHSSALLGTPRHSSAPQTVLGCSTLSILVVLQW